MFSLILSELENVFLRSSNFGVLCNSVLGRQRESSIMSVDALRSFNETEQRPLVNYTSILECGPMPNLMVALPNIDGALCSTPQSLADAHY